jgi:hypothetical protein
MDGRMVGWLGAEMPVVGTPKDFIVGSEFINEGRCKRSRRCNPSSVQS